MTSLVLWLLGPVVAVAGVWAVTDGRGRKRKAAAEAEGRRAAQPGITVEGWLESSYEERSGGDAVTKYVYSFAPFADVRGRGHERHGAQGRGAERVKVVYDPEDPENNIVYDPEDAANNIVYDPEGAANNKVGRGTVARPAGMRLLVVPVWSGSGRGWPGWSSCPWEWWHCSRGPERDGTSTAGRE